MKLVHVFFCLWATLFHNDKTTPPHRFLYSFLFLVLVNSFSVSSGNKKNINDWTRTRKGPVCISRIIIIINYISLVKSGMLFQLHFKNSPKTYFETIYHMHVCKLLLVFWQPFQATWSSKSPLTINSASILTILTFINAANRGQCSWSFYFHRTSFLYYVFLMLLKCSKNVCFNKINMISTCNLFNLLVLFSKVMK